MRSLVILRGACGSGKSTWIKNMNLENYTLCADTIRLLVESPILTADESKITISQQNDNYVWSLLFELLEKRMQRGEFVVIDATHSRSSDFSRYNNLCGKYRYRKYYVDFSDVDIETCKKQNLMREPYKRVPEKVIDKIYSRLMTQQKTSGWVEIDRNHFWDELGTKLFDLNKYTRIHILGDIHGCFEPLNEYFNTYPYSEEEMYIFTGDYIDRGIQNKETLLFLMELAKKPNVLFLEGNHEKCLRYYANDEIEEIKSNMFLKKTMFEILDIDKKELSKFCSKIGQIAYFEYDNKKYIVSHGGISYIPEQLQLVALTQFINGVGDYNVDIDKVFSENEKEIIQVHGHRNTYEIDNESNSYNLEGKVEFGGNLKVLQISKGQELQMIKIKNNTYGKAEEILEIKECRTTNVPNMPIVEQLRNCKSIRETKLDNNISSFNFTRDAFFKKDWNGLTTNARGLFINTETNEVVARGYEKFFNVNERRETELTHLATKFKDKITCYKKYNGFLGIMSLVNGELFIASKSTNKGEFAEYFKNIYEKSDIDKQQLLYFLEKNNVSLTFEVVDPINDPHIIENDKQELVLLDIIDNDIKFKKWDYEKVVELGKMINCNYKEIYKEFDNFRELHEWYIANTDEDDLTKTDLEGVVIECCGIMTKLKFPYYNFWKKMRHIKEVMAHRHNVKLSSLYNDVANYFYSYLKTLPEEELQKDIITLRKEFYERGTYKKCS